MPITTAATLPPLAATVVAAVDYKGTITLGSVIVFLSTVVAAAFINVRRKASDDRTDRVIKVAQDAAEAWQLECAAKDQKLERLEGDLVSERTRCNDALAEVVKWKERTDVTQFARDISEQNQAIIAELKALTTSVSALAVSLPQQLK